MSYVTQNISLRRNKFSKGDAIAWVRSHGYHAIKGVHVTPHFYEFRLIDPERLKGARFRTIDLGADGHMVLAYF